MITIDDPDLEAMLRVIGQETGETPAAVVRRALVAALRETTAARASPGGPLSSAEIARRRAVLLEIRERMDGLPALDPRSADEIIGYDDDGLPS